MQIKRVGSVRNRCKMADDIKCPICGSATILRTAKNGPNIGRFFHVCTKYPECKGKVQITKTAWIQKVLEDGSTHSMHLLALNQNTKLILGVTPTKDSYYLPAITTDGRISFIPAGSEAQYNKFLLEVQKRILERDPEGKLRSWVCAAVMITETIRPERHYLIFEVFGSQQPVPEVEHMYDCLASLKVVGDEHWINVAKMFSSDPAKSWVNKLIEGLKKDINWSEYIDKALQNEHENT